MTSGNNTVLVLQTLCTILQAQLGLDPDQVWVYNQKRDIPPSKNLWIVVRFLTGKPFGVSSKFVGNSAGGTEMQSVNMNSVITIDIFSRDLSALNAKELVIMAFRSIYSEQLQERYAFKIGQLPISFTDLSIIEGDAIPYRYQLGFQVQYKSDLQRSVSYYDQFPYSLAEEA